DEFRPVQGAHIGVLVERAGIDGLLARRDLRGRNLALAFKRWQRELVVRGNCHPDCSVHVGLADVGALLQNAIEAVERAPRLLGSRGRPLYGELVPARAYVDAKLLLEPGEILVELAIQGTGKPVVVESQNDVRHVRRARWCKRRRVLQFGRAQASLLSGLPSGRLGMQAVEACFRDSHIDNVTDSAGLFINY